MSDVAPIGKLVEEFRLNKTKNKEILKNRPSGLENVMRKDMNMHLGSYLTLVRLFQKKRLVIQI